MLTGLCAGGTPGAVTSTPAGGTLSLTYIGTNESVTSLSSFDFGNFSAGSDGLMIVAFTSRDDNHPTISSISIGGSNGTLIDLTSLGSVPTKPAWAYRQVSSGNNNVTVNMSGASGANTAYAVGVYLLTGNVADDPYVYDLTEGTGTTLSLTHGAAPFSVTLFAAFERGTANETASFSGATADIASDQIVASGRNRRYAHYTNSTVSQVERTETITWSAGVDTHYVMLASWR